MEKFYTNKITINKEQNSKRLDQALTILLGKYSRSQIKNFIINQYIKKAGKFVTDVSLKVKQGEKYNIKIPNIKKTEYQPENIPIKIIYEDKHIIIIDKNAGMVTHPAPGNQTGTLVQALLMHTNNNLSSINSVNRPGIIHRLDKDTSGLIIVAKNNFVHIKLAEQFKKHSISRKYLAVVWGKPNNQKIEGYIQRHKINRKKMSLNNFNKGKFSKTIISVKKSFKICSLVECELKTGRTHQIRVHLSSIGFPLIGDKIYSKNTVNKFSNDKDNIHKFLILKNFGRQALHAYHIGFLHPISGKNLVFESKVPKDMKNLLDFLVKY